VNHRDIDFDITLDIASDIACRSGYYRNHQQRHRERSRQGDLFAFIAHAVPSFYVSEEVARVNARNTSS